MESVVEIPMDTHIPHEYIPAELQRMQIYQRIARIDSRESRDDMRDELEDRYGEVPQSVLTLIDAAWIKSLCERAQIVQLIVRDGEARLQFHPRAQIDGGKLMLVAQQQGAFLQAGEQVTFVLVRKKSAAEAIMAELPQLIYTIARCIDSNE